MPLLLDTHVLLVWAVLAPYRLPDAVAAILSDDTDMIYVSPASAYELIQKVRTGKWPEASILSASFEREIALAGFERLEVSLQVMILAASFPSAHGDRWDRVLAAQSMISGYPLLSVDPLIDTFGVHRIWA